MKEKAIRFWQKKCFPSINDKKIYDLLIFFFRFRIFCRKLFFIFRSRFMLLMQQRSFSPAASPIKMRMARISVVFQERLMLLAGDKKPLSRSRILTPAVKWGLKADPVHSAYRSCDAMCHVHSLFSFFLSSLSRREKNNDEIRFSIDISLF